MQTSTEPSVTSSPLASDAAPRASEAATIADAFSRTARRYDEFAEDHPHLRRMREKVYRHLERVVPPGSRILELNAGTGTDAVHLASHGFRVHATDLAPGMLARLRDKAARLGLEDRLTIQECSFLELDRVPGGPFDAVFSDLGGLNCTPDVRPVIESVRGLLRPGGTVVWVLMPRICLWELGFVFAGQVRFALRRLSRHGTRAHLEGRHFDVFYFSPKEIVADFGPDFELLGVEGLSVITPTAESRNLARRHRTVYRALAWLDDLVSPHAPMSGWGDFFIVSLRYRGSADPATIPGGPGSAPAPPR